MRPELGNKLGGNDHRRALVRGMKWRPISKEAIIKGEERLGHIFHIPRAAKAGTGDFRNGVKSGKAQNEQMFFRFVSDS
jgi:hypothetical protein